MPRESHRSKYLIKMAIGYLTLLFFTAAIFATTIGIREFDSWYKKAAVAGVLLCVGAHFISEATLHKIKSDLHRRSKEKDDSQ